MLRSVRRRQWGGGRHGGCAERGGGALLSNRVAACRCLAAIYTALTVLLAVTAAKRDALHHRGNGF